MMMEKKLKIAVSGIGNRALPKSAEGSSWFGWIELINRSVFFELVAAHDPSEHAINRIVERGYLDSSNTFRDLSLMLSEVDCDALLVSNPADHHADTVAVALENDLHVLVEKPFVTDISEGRRLVDLINRKNRVVAVAQNWRSKDVGRILNESLSNGLAGRIGHVFFRYVRDRENSKYPAYIFEESYPLLYAMGIHHLDLLRYILKDEFKSVNGHSFKPPWSLYKSETGLNLYLETEGGTSVIYSGTISSKNRRIPQESLIIEGEYGTLLNESQWLEPPLWFYPAGKNEKINLTREAKKTTIFEQYNKSDTSLLENFYNSIMGAEAPLCTALDGLRSVKLLEASRMSCETKKTIYLSDFAVD